MSDFGKLNEPPLETNFEMIFWWRFFRTRHPNLHTLKLRTGECFYSVVIVHFPLLSSQSSLNIRFPVTV